VINCGGLEFCNLHTDYFPFNTVFVLCTRSFWLKLISTKSFPGEYVANVPNIVIPIGQIERVLSYAFRWVYLHRAVSDCTKSPVKAFGARFRGPEEVDLVVDDDAPGQIVRDAEQPAEVARRSGRPGDGQPLAPLGLLPALVRAIWKQVRKQIE
jgi:hypothetical protein